MPEDEHQKSSERVYFFTIHIEYSNEFRLSISDWICINYAGTRDEKGRAGDDSAL
jgi:hypothetical protein